MRPRTRSGLFVPIVCILKEPWQRLVRLVPHLTSSNLNPGLTNRKVAAMVVAATAAATPVMVAVATNSRAVTSNVRKAAAMANSRVATSSNVRKVVDILRASIKVAHVRKAVAMALHARKAVTSNVRKAVAIRHAHKVDLVVHVLVDLVARVPAVVPVVALALPVVDVPAVVPVAAPECLKSCW